MPPVQIPKAVLYAVVTMDMWGMALTAPVRTQSVLMVCIPYSYRRVLYHIDIDECAIGTHDCHRDSNATCKDTDGSFTCICSEGFDGNGTFCAGT